MIRVSGPCVRDLAERHVSSWPLSARHAKLCTFRDMDGNAIDHVLATFFPGPNSFTGEDVLEVAAHGGVVIPTLLVAALVGSGARPATAGEFTRRAVLNGKLDLAQAEATGDLIDAGSRAMQRIALAQLDGGLTQRINELRSEVIDLEAMIAYDIDFPDEDDGPISPQRVQTAAERLLQSLGALLATAPVGELVREGAIVVIAGPPNAGKSSLFNTLLGKQRAIVTEVPGTTRDAIEAVLDTYPWPIRLVDTAGLRDTDDVVERIGIEVCERYLGNADVVLACADMDQDVARIAGIVSKLTRAPILGVRTKCDLTSSGLPLAVSAATGSGTHEVLVAVMETISNSYLGQRGEIQQDAPVLTRERHRFAVQTARDEISQFVDAITTGEQPAAVTAVHLRSAAAALTDVVGAIDVEDVLDHLFRTFCVGK